MTRNSDAAEAFEWPPREDPHTCQVFEFTSEGIHPVQSASAPDATDAVASSHAADVPPDVLQTLLEEHEEEQEEVHVALRRTLEQRAAAANLADPTRPQPRVWSRIASAVGRVWPRIASVGPIVPVALAVTALFALLEGVYIVRILLQQPSSARANSQLLVASPERTAEPPSQRSKASDTAKPSTLTGRLVVRSDPPGAEVFVDGQQHGVTPLTLGSVSTGQHRILLKQDATELHQTVRIEPGVTTSLVVPIRLASPAFGWLTIDSPVEIDAFENGALLGTSRSSQFMIEAGSHTIDVVNENLGFRETRKLRVEPGKVERIAIELPQSTLNVEAMPWAEVWIAGKSVGETPIANLQMTIGTYEVVLRHPGLGEKTVSVTVKAGVPAHVSVDLRKEPSTQPEVRIQGRP
jgi:PEGA domain-containing protein